MAFSRAFSYSRSSGARRQAQSDKWLPANLIAKETYVMTTKEFKLTNIKNQAKYQTVRRDVCEQKVYNQYLRSNGERNPEGRREKE